MNNNNNNNNKWITQRKNKTVLFIGLNNKNEIPVEKVCLMFLMTVGEWEWRREKGGER